MQIKYAWKRSDGYIVFCDYPAYGVLIRQNDPRCPEVEAYLLTHPEAIHPEPLPPPPTDAQLEAAAEAQRQARFAEYDTAIMRLKRSERMGDTTATASIAQWDEYAVALQMLNDEPGWFRAPVWPEKPAV